MILNINETCCSRTITKLLLTVVSSCNRISVIVVMGLVGASRKSPCPVIIIIIKMATCVTLK